MIDFPLIINLCIILSAYLHKKKGKPYYLALLSTGYIFLILTSGYMFFRYGCREAASPITWFYVFLAPVLFLWSISALIFIYWKNKSFGIEAFLKQYLSEDQRRRFNRYGVGIAFYLVMTVLIGFGAYYYDKTHPHAFYADPNDYFTLTILHWIWQFFYVLPLYYVFTQMGLNKFSKAFVLCSLVYFGAIALPLFLGFFIAEFTRIF
jgi:hypothetical protein